MSANAKVRANALDYPGAGQDQPAKSSIINEKSDANRRTAVELERVNRLQRLRGRTRITDFLGERAGARTRDPLIKSLISKLFCKYPTPRHSAISY